MWGPNRRRLFRRNVSGGVWRLERWLYSQACLSLLFYSQSNSFVEALGPETKFTQFTIIVLWWYWKKKREFFRYKLPFLQVSIFWFLGFAKFAKFTINTTTELVKFYSLNTENKEHDMLRVKMLTKIIMAIFFSVHSASGKWTYFN